MHSRAQFPLQVLLLTAALCLGVTHTGHAVTQQLFPGQVTGTFSSPVELTSAPPGVNFPGQLKDANGNPISQNNSSTAVCSLPSCPVFSGAVGPNEFHWGANSAPSPGVDPFSSFVFKGADTTLPCGGLVGVPCDAFVQGQGVHANTIFPLGTFTYTNGESALNSLVFGVHFQFAWSAACQPSTPGCLDVNPFNDDLIITTTVNTGAGGKTDADTVTFAIQLCTTDPNNTVQPVCSDASALVGVFEGAKATVTLLGLIESDPDLVLTGVTLPPGDPNGFVTIVPEPGSLILLGLGLGGIALTRRLRPVKH